MNSLFDTLTRRGFVARATDDELGNRLQRERLTVYAGFDPTADSLHLGHLVPVMVLAHLQRAGHKVIALVGGATGMIGDPSGRSAERNLLSQDAVAENAAAIRRQLESFLSFDGDNAAQCVDNRDWFRGVELLDFLRDTGKHFSVATMLAKDSVKGRLASENGISFTEFTYQILQASDFLHLFNAFGCTLQIGGSDQWGNIVAGIDLIRRKTGEQAFGLTLPLVTTGDGQKFGKSAGNAVWLDAKRTSPWALFQYLVRQEDADVGKLLRLFTFLPEEEIAEMERSVVEKPESRAAQRKLAVEVTALIHGREVAEEMVRAADVMFGGGLTGLSAASVEMVFGTVPHSELSAPELAEGVRLSAMFAKAKLAPSVTQARKLIAGGGAYINNQQIKEDVLLGCNHLATARHIVLRSGKKNFHLVRIV